MTTRLTFTDTLWQAAAALGETQRTPPVSRKWHAKVAERIVDTLDHNVLVVLTLDEAKALRSQLSGAAITLAKSSVIDQIDHELANH